MIWKELSRFKSVFGFIGRFFLVYLVGNLLYGWMVMSWRPVADPVTREVTREVVLVLNQLGFETHTVDHRSKPNINIVLNQRPIVAVYEGCSGLNVMIVWLAFLIAMGPWNFRLVWFTVAGMVVIHMMNLVRLVALFEVSLYWPQHFFFIHKYLFTAFLYVFVFLGWVLWLWMNRRGRHGAGASGN